MASFPGERRALQVFPVGGVDGSKLRNLLTNFSELARFLPSAVMLTRHPFLESKDLRISSRDEEMPAQSSSTLCSRDLRNSK